MSSSSKHFHRKGSRDKGKQHSHHRSRRQARSEVPAIKEQEQSDTTQSYFDENYDEGQDERYRARRSYPREYYEEETRDALETGSLYNQRNKADCLGVVQPTAWGCIPSKMQFNPYQSDNQGTSQAEMSIRWPYGKPTIATSQKDPLLYAATWMTPPATNTQAFCTSVATWSIRTVPGTVPGTAPGDYQARVHYPSADEDTRETIVNRWDQRTAVSSLDIGVRGRYRAVCKLFIRFEGNTDNVWDGGTGFLVANDTVVTCAHNVCGPTYGTRIAHAYDVRVYIGLSGQAEGICRRARHIAVGWNYYQDSKKDYNDIAVIILDRPFDTSEVTPMTYSTSHPAGTQARDLTVVGFPGELPADPLNIGRVMYECTGKDNTERGDIKLKYQIDTSPGQSGSPVLYQGIAIGVHTGGFRRRTTYNRGTSLSYPSNNVNDFRTALWAQGDPECQQLVGLVQLSFVNHYSDSVEDVRRIDVLETD